MSEFDETAREILEASKCSRITNVLNSGKVFERNLDPSARWHILYVYAKKRPQEFEMEYDRDVVVNDPKLGVVYDRALLKTKGIKDLREIGSSFGVTSSSKDGLIDVILAKQEKILSEMGV